MPCTAAQGSISKRLLFSEEKRSKKDFIRLRRKGHASNEQKFFGSFFQKRTASFLPAPPRVAQRCTLRLAFRQRHQAEKTEETS
jgi:hypothetical protein